MYSENGVAKQILEQLGGPQFIIMTGSHTFLSFDNCLKMRLRQNNARARWLTIELNTGTDTYSMHFYTLNADLRVITRIKLDGIHAEQLQEQFTKVTGLETKL